ncbi:B3/4 domain-containing protein [Bacillota bacterium]
MRFEIEKAVFEHFPGMRIVTAVARDIKPTAEKEKIADELQQAWQIAAAACEEYGNAQSHPNIVPWGERMKAVGAPRKKFPSSIEALVRRAGKSDTPVSVSPLVDFYNSISLRHIVPAGGYDIDALKSDLRLRFSRSGDRFLALDSDEAVMLPEGEVSYADGSEIITRHFVWKQSRHAILTPESKAVIFVSEILGELPEETAGKVAKAFPVGLNQFFGINSSVYILDADNNSIEI